MEIVLAEIKSANISNDLSRDILSGLSKEKKTIPSKYLYDERGCDLFNRITRHPDYYLTRCELEILTTYTPNLLEHIGHEAFNLVELGPGEGLKTTILLNYFLQKKIPFNYIPIDISEKYLSVFTEKLLQEQPQLHVTPIRGDYASGLSWLKKHTAERNVVLFLGSSIGNFDLPGAQQFLTRLQHILNPGDFLLIGFDLRKTISVLLKAYDDNEGITRAFNLNLLQRINDELSADFNLDYFYHYATYNVYTGAMESYLISLHEQTVKMNALGQSFHFDPFEAIHVEYSYKYLPSQIHDLAEQCGFHIIAQFKDSQKYFVDSLWQVIR